MNVFALYLKFFKLSVQAVFFLCFINPFIQIYAAQAVSPEQDRTQNAQTKTGPMMDNTQKEISKGVVSAAQWIDSFFKDESYQVENNTTNLWIRMGTFKEEREGVKFNFTPILTLVLPYTEKKLRLEIISSTDEDLNVYNEKPPLENTQFINSQNEPTSATLRYFFLAKNTLNLSMAAGAYADQGTPRFYIGPRSRLTANFRMWEITFVEWLRGISDGGLESETRIDLDYPFRERLLFRTRLEGDWRSEEDEFLHSASLLLYQQLSRNRALAYEYNNLFTTKPTHRLEEINFRVKYRQRIWRDWLFAELAPQVSFPRDRDFHRTLGILFRIELYFGPESLTGQNSE